MKIFANLPSILPKNTPDNVGTEYDQKMRILNKQKLIDLQKSHERRKKAHTHG
jgi:hypothetical protein